MNLYAVSFFGHRQIDNVFVIEQRLETMIRELLLSKEYVGNDEIFGDRCGIDCNEAIEKYNLCYVNYDAEDDVRTIEFEDFQVGDDVIIGLYDGEIENAFNKTAVAEQVQLATQRLN